MSLLYDRGRVYAMIANAKMTSITNLRPNLDNGWQSPFLDFPIKVMCDYCGDESPFLYVRRNDRVIHENRVYSFLYKCPDCKLRTALGTLIRLDGRPLKANIYTTLIYLAIDGGMSPINGPLEFNCQFIANKIEDDRESDPFNLEDENTPVFSGGEELGIVRCVNCRYIRKSSTVGSKTISLIRNLDNLTQVANVDP